MTSTTTIAQLKKRIQQLNRLITKFSRSRSLVRKWGFELVVLEGELDLASEPKEKPMIRNLIWTLRGSTRKEQARKKWVAQIAGQNSVYTFDRQFLAESHIEWGKHGTQEVEFLIDRPGYYQDSDGDYFKVFVKDGCLIGEICSYQEVHHQFYKVVIA